MNTEELKKQWDMELNKLSELNDFAYDLIKKVSENNLSTEDMVVYMNFKRIIEVIKGTSALLSENLGGLADSLLRDLMEAYANLIFITEDKKQVNERALAYYYQHLNNSLKEFYGLKKLYREDKESVKIIQEEINLIRKQQQSLELASINQQWNKWKEEHEYDPYYFLLFIKVKSINKFVQKYTPEEVEDKLYAFTSTQVHGLNTVRDLDMLKEKGDISQIYYLRADSKVLPNATYYLLYAISTFLVYFEMLDEKYMKQVEEILK